MPVTQTRDYGPVEYDANDILRFVRPLAGFPGLDDFLVIRPDPAGPWVVLQSLQAAGTAFLSLPVRLLAPRYDIRLTIEERVALGWREGIPENPLALALVADGGRGKALANLLGPVVADPSSRRALQAIRDDGKYGASEDVESWLAAREFTAC